MGFSKLDNQNKIPAKNSVKLSTEKVNKKAVWGLDYTYNNGKTWVKATVNEDYNGELKITVVATWFDEDSNKNFIVDTKPNLLKTNPFGRKPVTDSRITSSASVVPPKPKAPEDDLDIPSFLRKKI